MAKLNVEVFADGADIEEMKAAYKNKQVDGFTTNPSLMAKAGVTDYKAFAEEAVREIPDASISFEVIVLKSMGSVFLIERNRSMR